MLKTTSSFDTPLQQLLLLEERVRRTGATLPEDAGQQERFNGIKCFIQGRNCLVDIRSVAEVLEEKQVTWVPGAVAWIEGVMNFRGTMVPVYDLNKFFESDQASESGQHQSPLLVLRHDREYFACRVERIVGMKKYPLEDFEEIESDSDTKESGVLDSYIDASIEENNDRWLRLNIHALLGEMTEQNPIPEQAEPDEQVEESSEAGEAEEV